MVILAEGDCILPEYLPQAIYKGREELPPKEFGYYGGSLKLREAVAEAEKQVILTALQICGYNKTKAAEILGIPRSTLYYKIQNLNLKL